MPQQRAPEAIGLIPVTPVYGYGDQSQTPGALPRGVFPSVNDGQGPSWARASNVFITGHSYSAYNANPFTDLNTGQLTHPRGQWSQVFPELLGLSEEERYLYAPVPAVAAGSDATTIIGVVPEGSMVESIAYIPNAAVTGANTNSRTLQVMATGILGPGTLANLPLVAGVNLVSPVDVGAAGASHTFNLIAAPNQVVASTAFAFRDQNGAYISLGPSDQITIGNGVYLAGAVLFWKSLHVGTGLADPGGLVVVRLGGRIRNCAVSGSTAIGSGVYAGGFACCRTFRPLPQYISGEVNVSATAAQNAVSITVDALTLPLSNGFNLRFVTPTGAIVTTQLTAGAAVNATSLSVTALPAQVPIGSQGAVTPPFDTNIPDKVWCILQGINDASLSPLEVSGWREAMRYMIAQGLCPYVTHSRRSNHQYTNGTNGAWAALAPAKPGNVPQVTANLSGSSIFTASGALNPASLPSFTFTVAPDMMDGDAIDLFFYALVGTGHGARGTISVDGVPWATFDTSGVATIAGSSALGIRSMTATTSNGANTLVQSAGSTFQDPADIGRYVTGPGVAPNTVIASITDATHAVLSQNAGAAAGSGAVQLIPFIGMVKRLTGIQPGVGHFVTLTVTGIDATDGTAALVYAEYGIEARNPRSPILVFNVPRIPSKAFASDAAVGQLNAELLNVLQGTASAPGIGSTEPQMPASVVLVDIDNLLGGDQTFFTADGVHPNSRGHGIIANAAYDALRTSFSTRTLAAR